MSSPERRRKWVEMELSHGTGGGAAATADRVSGLPPDDQELMRSVLGSFATGVTVVTVGGRSPHGMTANSFTSVSLDPPLVLVCVRRDATMHEALAASGSFAVSVLAAEQVETARYFASRQRPKGGAQFDRVACSPGAHTGAPLIDSSLAWLECVLWRTYDGGDHSIFLGRTLSVGRRDYGGAALVFMAGQFWELLAGGQA